MKKDDTYKMIEDKFVKYRDLIDIEVREVNDTFITLPSSLVKEYGVIGRYEALGDMKENFPTVPLRSLAKERLDKADSLLKKKDPKLQLVAAYGYRSLEVQQKYFDEQKKNYLANSQSSETEQDIDEIIHRLIAVPEVAGHPTGGAVDVFIEDSETGEKLDFGVPLFTFDTKDVYTFSPFITQEAKQNRELLREIMLSNGFAPYDGEWWHFSFGDKEWAFYYKENEAMYSQKQEKEVLDSVAHPFDNPLR